MKLREMYKENHTPYKLDMNPSMIESFTFILLRSINNSIIVFSIPKDIIDKLSYI